MTENVELDKARAAKKDRAMDPGLIKIKQTDNGQYKISIELTDDEWVIFDDVSPEFAKEVVDGLAEQGHKPDIIGGRWVH